MIGNQEFLKTETDKIAKHMLKTCNYYHSKNKNKTNDKIVKSGENKSMNVNHLTVKEFQQKFNLEK